MEVSAFRFAKFYRYEIDVAFTKKFDSPAEKRWKFRRLNEPIITYRNVFISSEKVIKISLTSTFLHGYIN